MDIYVVYGKRLEIEGLDIEIKTRLITAFTSLESAEDYCYNYNLKESEFKSISWENITLNINDNSIFKDNIIQIVKRLIELEKSYFDKASDCQKKAYRIRREEEKADKLQHEFLRNKGLSDGLGNALTVIDGLTHYDPDIHKLIDDSRK